MRRDGKSGYFDIETRRLLVPADYDMIIPYATGETIVKQDTVYGWYDGDWQYHSGFPSVQAGTVITSFKYLDRQFSFNRDTHLYCEIPSEDHAGYGIFMAPSYLTKTGIFREIQGGLSTTKVPLNGWTEYVKTDGSLLERITDNVSALVTEVTERYIEGREEFYKHNHVVFVNAKHDTLGVANLNGGEISIQHIDSTLIEVIAPPDYEFYMGDYDVDELPVHTYFRLNENQGITQLPSSRLFAQTQYVKLDSTLCRKNIRDGILPSMARKK